MKVELSPAELEIIEEYRKHLNVYRDNRIGYAKRMLAYSNPDAIILVEPEFLLDCMIKDGYLKQGGYTVSKGKANRLYYVRSFWNWLNEKHQEGQHEDTWFEPEWMEKQK